MNINDADDFHARICECTVCRGILNGDLRNLGQFRRFRVEGRKHRRITNAGQREEVPVSLLAGKGERDRECSQRERRKPESRNGGNRHRVHGPSSVFRVGRSCQPSCDAGIRRFNRLLSMNPCNLENLNGFSNHHQEGDAKDPVFPRVETELPAIA